MFAKTYETTRIITGLSCNRTHSSERGSCAGKTPRRPRVGDRVTPAFPSLAASSVVAAGTVGKAGAVHIRTETHVGDGVENKQGIILEASLPRPLLGKQMGRD